MELQIIGCGKMGQALLAGLINDVAPAAEITAVDPSDEIRQQIARDYPGVSVATEALPNVPTILAVKPHLAVEIAAALPPVPRLLSVAAGITTGALEKVTNAAVVRCMPNTPALLGKGAAGVAIGGSAGQDDLNWGLRILAAAGHSVAVTEDQIDAVTGLSGSGPAYIFRIAEAMTSAGIAVGLTPDVARGLSYQTIAGAGAMLAEPGADAAQLRANVTTPNGTTAAGLAVLDECGIEEILADVVAAATERSRQLGAQ
ncbi:MAG: pyrroline-5-carboxylate reductase [Acidimicrobiales bacterium]|nr:pyrroline-5-carboxylate reductase [Acidimicrobiales bacterium]